MKNFVRGTKWKIRKRRYFRTNIGIESVHRASNDSNVRTVNFASSKNQIL